MMEDVLAGPQPWRFGHLLLPGGSTNLGSSGYELRPRTGRQDAMQRQTLVPLAPHMRQLPPSPTPPKVMDVAAGTGRFGTFLKVPAASTRASPPSASRSALPPAPCEDEHLLAPSRSTFEAAGASTSCRHGGRVQDNHPHAEVTVLELSPFYLQQARDNFAEWGKVGPRCGRHSVWPCLPAAAGCPTGCAGRPWGAPLRGAGCSAGGGLAHALARPGVHTHCWGRAAGLSPGAAGAHPSCAC